MGACQSALPCTALIPARFTAISSNSLADAKVGTLQVNALQGDLKQSSSEAAALRSRQVHQEHLEATQRHLQEEVSQLQAKLAQAQARATTVEGLEHANTQLHHQISKAHLELDHMERRAAAGAKADSLHSQVRGCVQMNVSTVRQSIMKLVNLVPASLHAEAISLHSQVTRNEEINMHVTVIRQFNPKHASLHAITLQPLYRSSQSLHPGSHHIGMHQTCHDQTDIIGLSEVGSLHSHVRRMHHTGLNQTCCEQTDRIFPKFIVRRKSTASQPRASQRVMLALVMPLHMHVTALL